MRKKSLCIGLVFALLFTACRDSGSSNDLQTTIAQTSPPELAITVEPERSSWPPPPKQEQMLELEDATVIRESPFDETELRLYAQNVYYSIYLFSEGMLYTNGDSPKMPAASVIKVFIMQYAYSLIAQGKLSADDTIAGQGVRQLIESMIQQSDNTATNILIDYFGMDEMNQYFLEQGFAETVLQRRMLDTAARNQGLDNYTSTRDALAFLRHLYINQTVFPYDEMLEVMKGQQVRTKIHLFLPPDTIVASKTGELHDVENDIGLVFAEDSAFAIVVLTDGVHNSAAARQAIGRLALQAYLYNRD